MSHLDSYIPETTSFYINFQMYVNRIACNRNIISGRNMFAIKPKKMSCIQLPLKFVPKRRQEKKNRKKIDFLNENVRLKISDALQRESMHLL